MRVVFLGSGPFAVPALEALARGEHRPLLVVTRPDRPAGRGRKVLPTPVKVRAAELGLPHQSPETVNDAAWIEDLRAQAPDLILVADYGELLRKPIRDLPRVGIFNLHASLLPRHRGAAPVVASLLAGDRESGVTLFRIEKGLDSGPVLDRVATSIGEVETAGELEARLALLAAEVLERNLPRLAAGSFAEEAQDESLATRAPKIEKGAGAIDWTRPAEEVAGLIRALSPRPGAFSHLERAGGPSPRIRFLRARAGPGPEAPPGTVTRVEKRGFRVAAAGGEVEVLDLQPEARPPMPAADFLRGHPLVVGDRFMNQEQ